MNCPKCKSELEIFVRDSKEIYVCPLCLSALCPKESSIKALKYFCNQEIMSQLISNLLDDSLFDNTKGMLSAEENLACPKCKSYMQQYDFNRKLRFSVNRCIGCGALWINSAQIPLVSVSFIENNPDDLNFKKSINDLYEILARKRSKKVRPFDEVIAPYAVITQILPAIPISDNVLKKARPLVTRGLIIACILVFLLQISTQEVKSTFSLIADKILTQSQWYRLLTHAFLHGGILHLLGNMWFLWVFGRGVEDELGWKKYSFLFIVGAIFSGIFFIATMTRKDVPCVGASGAISGIIGAYLILFPKAKLRFRILYPVIINTYVSSMYYILSWVIINIVFGIIQTGRDAVGVAYWGHIGGFVSGIIYAELYKNFK